MIIDKNQYMGTHKMIGGGSEGNVYLNTPDTCIKLFHPKACTEQKRTRLQVMVSLNALKNRRDVAWPIELVYDRDRSFIGYVMPYIKEAWDLNELLLFRLYQFDTRFIVKMAVGIVETVRIIHSNGFTICDWNPKNVMLSDEGSVRFIDCDNYQFRLSNGQEFRPQVAFGEYLSRKLQKLKAKYVTLNKSVDDYPFGSFDYDSDCFGLGVLIFQLLMNGVHPYKGVAAAGNLEDIPYNIYHDYSPYFGKGNASDISPEMLPLNVLPNSLQEFFHDCFFKEVHPKDFEVRLIGLLNDYGNQLTRQCRTVKNHLFMSTFNECPFCRVHREKERIKNELIKRNNHVTGCVISPGGALYPPTGTAPTAAANTAAAPSAAAASAVAVTSGNHMTGTGTETAMKTVVWSLFAIAVIVQIAIFGSGYTKAYYDYNLSGDFMVLQPFAQYLHLILSVVVALLLTVIFQNMDFGVPVIMLIDIASQFAAGAIMFTLVSIIIALGSVALVIVIIALIFAFFIGAAG